MPNDDLGQFPTPPTSTPPATTPTEPAPVKPDVTSLLDDINAPAPTQISTEPFTTPPIIPTSQESPTTPSNFEETPETIPSAITPPAPVLATAPPSSKGGTAFGSLIVIILLLISGVALAVTVFLYSQSQQLKQQLVEVTQTLEQQRTTVTPTPTPTIIDFPTPSLTPEATESAIITPSPTATISSTTMPLLDAPKALKVAINHLPNAQLLLLKTDNATNPSFASTKYFFRQDLTTKKYFYVLIAGDKDPEIVDKAIYVTPDNNIPSLNDTIQGNTYGMDLDEAVTIANAACTSGLCSTATVRAQYIKSGANFIWQLTFDPVDAAKNALVIQLNAATKEILFKSAGF